MNIREAPNNQDKPYLEIEITRREARQILHILKGSSVLDGDITQNPIARIYSALEQRRADAE